MLYDAFKKLSFMLRLLFSKFKLSGLKKVIFLMDYMGVIQPRNSVIGFVGYQK